MKAIYDIVGMRFLDAEKFVRGLPNGEPMTLVHDPSNVFDHNAVQVWARGQRIGFIKREQAAKLAPRLDARSNGNHVGRLVMIDKFPRVEIEE